MKSVLLGLAALAGVEAGKGWDRAFEILAKHAPATSKTNSTAVLHSYKSCSKADATAQNLVINISPDPPSAGQSVTTMYDYDLTKEITGGKASYKVSYNGIPFPATVDDLCADQAGGTQPDPCPMAVGTHHDKSISDFPSGVSGKIVFTTTWTDQDDAQVLCVEWTVKL